MLQLEDRLGVEEVVLALATPLVLATEVERAVGALVGVAGYADRVPSGDLVGQHVEPDPAEPAHRPGEVLVDELPPEADRLEHLGTRVGRDGGDAHLRHHLEHALARGLDVVLHGLVRVDAGQAALDDQVLDGLEREVRVDRARAVADEQRHVMHLARIARLDHEPDLRARLLADQVVVHRCSHQQ